MIQPTTLKNTPDDQATRHAARHLLGAVDRILRSPTRQAGWIVLVLHLSRIPPPGPRSHHRRVAMAVLDDAAAKGTGQLFAMVNSDIVLLFRPPDSATALLGILARLFKADVPDTDNLRTVWRLPAETEPLLAYLKERVTQGDRALPPEPQSSPGAVAAMEDVVQTGNLSDLLHRQTAVLLSPGRSVPLVPLFREVAISTAVLEARIVGANAAADPFLFTHLAARLDRRMLGALRDDIPNDGPLARGMGAAALHINMTIAGILSQSFAAFATVCAPAIASGLRIGIELPFVEVFADIKSFILARERLRLAGLHLILDGLNHHLLVVSSPGTLDPSLVKLNWSASIIDATIEVAAAIARVGKERVVLHRVENEAAIAWGIKCGVTRFQGRYIDVMLAAERLRSCPQAKTCTFLQCRERASATGPAGRAGCRNLPLLDLGAPLYKPSDASAPVNAAAVA